MPELLMIQQIFGPILGAGFSGLSHWTTPNLGDIGPYV